MKIPRLCMAKWRLPLRDLRDNLNPRRGFDQSAMLTSYRVWDLFCVHAIHIACVEFVTQPTTLDIHILNKCAYESLHNSNLESPIIKVINFGHLVSCEKQLWSVASCTLFTDHRWEFCVEMKAHKCSYYTYSTASITQLDAPNKERGHWSWKTCHVYPELYLLCICLLEQRWPINIPFFLMHKT